MSCCSHIFGCSVSAGMLCFHPPCGNVMLPPTMRECYAPTHHAGMLCSHPPCGNVMLPPTMRECYAPTHHAGMLCSHPPCGNVMLPPTMRECYAPTHHAGMLCSHPPCGNVMLPPTTPALGFCILNIVPGYVFLCVVFTLLHHMLLGLVIKMHAGFTHNPSFYVASVGSFSL